MTASTQPTLDKLPVELREEIFKEVLCYDGVLAQVGSGDPAAATFDISLLVALVNDVGHYALAYETFYKHNTFRLGTYDGLARLTSDVPCGPHKHIRHLELSDESPSDCTWRDLKPTTFRLIFETAEQWPKLKTLRLDLEPLVWPAEEAWMRKTIVAAVGRPAAGKSLSCKGVGQYMYDLGTRFEVRFEHFKLVRSWARTQKEEALTLREMAERFAAQNEINTSSFTNLDYVARRVAETAYVPSVQLAGWLELCEEYFEKVNQMLLGGYPAAPVDILSMIEHTIFFNFSDVSDGVVIRHADWARARSGKLRDIKAGKSSEKLLDQVGDLIVASSTRFPNILA